MVKLWSNGVLLGVAGGRRPNPLVFHQQMAQVVGDVAVGYHVERATLRQRVGQCAQQAVGQRGQALVRRRASPAQRDGHVLLAFFQVVLAKA